MLALQDTSLFREAALVGDRWVEANGHGFAVANPSTGAIISHVPDLGAAEAAIQVAEAGQKGWAARTAKECAQILRRWFELMMVHQDDLGRILTAEHVADALAKRGKVTLGGKPHALGGTFWQPTIITGVTAETAVAREETFGPLAPIFRFETEAEVIASANDTDFGLASYLFSLNLARVFLVSEALEYGMVGVNTSFISTARAPFGGVNASGLGRERSCHGLDDFLELKYVCLGGLQ